MPVDPTRTEPTAMRGYADTLSRAFEWALTTAIFLGVGIVLDRVLGTAPVFVIVLTLFGVAGQFTRMWYAYAGQMREHEAAVPSAVAARSAAESLGLPSGSPDRPAVPLSDRDRVTLPSTTAQVLGLLRRRESA
jgi:F0F1-type ATP synthase assembly protein I